MISNDELEVLSSFLYDELNSLASGWGIKRTCAAHNIITFCVWYCSNTNGGVDDLVRCSKQDIQKVLSRYRYPEDGVDNVYSWWHNQSRDITDHADKYQGKSPVVFLHDLFKFYDKVIDRYKSGDF